MSVGRPILNSIQVIRAIAFILVFLSHVELIDTGPIGVSMFLVISGFCMTYSYLDRPEKLLIPSIENSFKFAWGKIKKLYPLHVFTLVCVALVIFAGHILHKSIGMEMVEQGGYFFANALLLQSWLPWRDGYYSFNAVSWYFSTSAFSYFIFLWVFRLIQSHNKKRIIKLFIFILGLMLLIASVLGFGQQNFGWSRSFIKWVVYICPFYRAGDFIIGLVAGYVFISSKKESYGVVLHTALQVVVFVLMAAQVFLYISGTFNAVYLTFSLFWLPSSVGCVYLFAMNKGLVSRGLLKSRFLVWIGNISGEAFLIHQICIKAVEYITKNKWLIAAIAFPLTIIATVIWRFLYKKVFMRKADI